MTKEDLKLIKIKLWEVGQIECKIGILHNSVKKHMKDLENLEYEYDCIQGIDYSKSKVQSNSLSTTDNTVIKIQKNKEFHTQEIRKALKYIYKLEQKQNSVMKAIEKNLEPDEIQIIQLKYFDRIKWDYIPARVHLSRRTCCRLHDRALNKLSSFL